MTRIDAKTGPSSEPVSHEAAASEPSPTAISDPMLELAALLVESDFARAEMDAENLRAAREAERRAMNAEIAAMRRAADFIEQQAWVQGGIAVAGGAAQCAGYVSQATSTAARTPWEAGLQHGGAAAMAVAEPAGQLVGGVAKAQADTDAAQARNAADQAGSRAEEAQRHLERVRDHTDRVLELVEGVIETEAQGDFAILGNF
jgi:hypothetical protein